MITAADAHYEYIKRARPNNEYIQRHSPPSLSMAVATAAEQCHRDEFYIPTVIRLTFWY